MHSGYAVGARASSRKPKRKSYQDFVADTGKAPRTKVLKTDVVAEHSGTEQLDAADEGNGAIDGDIVSDDMETKVVKCIADTSNPEQTSQNGVENGDGESHDEEQTQNDLLQSWEVKEEHLVHVQEADSSVGDEEKQKSDLSVTDQRKEPSNSGENSAKAALQDDIGSSAEALENNDADLSLHHDNGNELTNCVYNSIKPSEPANVVANVSDSEPCIEPSTETTEKPVIGDARSSASTECKVPEDRPIPVIKADHTVTNDKTRSRSSTIQPKADEKVEPKPFNIGKERSCRKKTKDSQKPKRIYICKKSGCGKNINRCAVKANSACCEATGYSSRWYHLSLEEHYCNACFEQFYRNKYDGFDEFHEWKRAWMNNSKSDSGFKNIATYISEKQLPYWVKCTRCDHWRQLGNEVDLTNDIIKTYICSMGNMLNTVGDQGQGSQHRMPHVKYTCYQEHDPSVNVVLKSNSTWMNNLNYTPFLKFSPAAPFLTSYYPDGVGMSAVDIDETPLQISCESSNVLMTPAISKLIEQQSGSGKGQDATTSNGPPVKKVKDGESRLLMSPGGRKSMNQSAKAGEHDNGYFHPFYKPFEHGKALCMRPDVMELDEAQEFPEYVKDQAIYLALRNLVVALWTLQQKCFLTTKRCCEFVILRGLTRIHLCELLLPRIICFATYKGLINIGALGNPTGGALLPKRFLKKDVIVIGAGPAGLGGARQLHNFGIKVTVLEARNRIGGRVDDDWSLDGVCVGRGAQIVNGCINNPMALMSEQFGLKMQVLGSKCDLYDGNGSPIAANFDKRMDFHFNALLDIIAEWRRNQQENFDSSLGEKILEAHQEWIKQSGLTFSDLEEQLLQFHIGNLEFACGICLDKVSAFHWDQNETFAQFNGDHTLVQYGFSSLLEALAKGLDIRFDSPVSAIDYSDKNGRVKVKVQSGEVFEADCALITVPLAVLKSRAIEFIPDLPRAKQDAMKKIGCGCIEKIGLEFEQRFWDAKINGANYFGYVPTDTTKKGFFTMFYDVPNVNLRNANVLMSVISGECVSAAAKMTEEEIIGIAMTILRKIFPDKSIPEPKRYFVTRWKDDPYAQMAYSYIKTHSSGEEYDRLAQSVDSRLYFAGEATNRHFPQTVTGAYLSGLREAAKIAVYKT